MLSDAANPQFMPTQGYDIMESEIEATKHASIWDGTPKNGLAAIGKEAEVTGYVLPRDSDIFGGQTPTGW